MSSDANTSLSVPSDQLEAIAEDHPTASLLINDDVSLDFDQELKNLLDEQLPAYVAAGQSKVSRDKLIALQRKDKSLGRYFDIVAYNHQMLVM